MPRVHPASAGPYLDIPDEERLASEGPRHEGDVCKRSRKSGG